MTINVGMHIRNLTRRYAVYKKATHGRIKCVVGVSDTNISLGLETILRNIPHIYHILISVGTFRMQGLGQCS